MTTEDRATRPTIHLTNASSKKHHGPGRLICAMANPAKHHRGDGRCLACAPFGDDLAWVLEVLAGPDDAGQHRAVLAAYRGAFEGRCNSRAALGRFAPGSLSFVTWRGPDARPSEEKVADGDTLFCACARPGTPKRRTPCHVEILVPYLVRAGWDVRLDGRLVTCDGCDCNVGPPTHRGDGEVECRGRPWWAEGEPGRYRAEAFGWPEAT